VADTFLYLQGKDYKLNGSGIGLTETSISVTSLTLPNSDALITMSMFGTLGYATLEPSTNRIENISFTGITQNSNGTATLTGVIRGLKLISPYDQDISLIKSHGGGTILRFTNSAPFYNALTGKNNDEEITGQWTVPTPLSGGVIANKDYVDSLTLATGLSYDSITISGKAGETVTAGALVYFNTADQEWYLADATVLAEVNDVQLGIAQGAGVDGGAINKGVLIKGLDKNNTGLTPGSIYYAGDTAGVISSSGGTYERRIGVAKSSTELIFNPEWGTSPTASQKDALIGSQGVPNLANPYITKDNVSTAETDQTQTTQNSSMETGEANVTTKKNLIAQSFIPTKTKIRGVKLYKSANTGTFTGNVVVTLKADSAGSPTGSALATATITNIVYNGLTVGEFEALFASEYASLVVGSLYWIVITPSTSDTSNHPNLGTNTAGGYTSGSVKYYNGTDGWVAVANIDLYFKTLEGIVSQVVKTNTSGKIENAFYDISEMPMPFIPQRIPIRTDSNDANSLSFTTNNDGSIGIITYVTSSTSVYIYRVVRDAKSLNYYITHTVNLSVQSFGYNRATIIGNYVYVVNLTGGVPACKRYDLADLANATDMTFSGTGYNDISFTDGTNLYIYRTSDTFVKYTISGTTLTNDGDVVYTSAGTPLATVSDSLGYVYTTEADGTMSVATLKKYAITGGAIISSTSLYIGTEAFCDVNQLHSMFKAQTDLIGFMTAEVIYDATTQTGTLVNLLFAITKP